MTASNDFRHQLLTNPTNTDPPVKVYNNPRNKQQRCSVRNAFVTNVAKFTGKNLWQNLFFNYQSCRLYACN